LAVIKVVDESYFLVPTAFTPNNDGINDQLSLIVIGLIDLQFFKIYDRWGNIVFQSSQTATKWNGMHKSQPLPTGTYKWIAQGTDLFGNMIKGSGSVTLIR
jgi:gliding motility-associated-like protein